MKKTPVDVFSSVGGAAFWESMLSVWEAHGWSVSRYHAIDEFAYRRCRVGIAGYWLRWKMYGQYAFLCWRAVRLQRENISLRVVTTNPFYAPALAQYFSGGRGITINLLYDLYPDALEHAGVCRVGSRLSRFLAKSTQYALRECAATVFLGDHLRDHAESRYGFAQRSRVIPVGADTTPFKDKKPVPLEEGQKLQLLYSGQLGRMHDTGTLVKFVKSGLPADVHLMMNASGSGYDELKRTLPVVPQCSYGGTLGHGEWTTAMARAQVALVTIAPGAENVVMPSKTYSALAAGQAIIAICSRNSDLADLVLRHDCGWVIQPGEVETLRKVVQLASTDRAQLQIKRENAYQVGHSVYSIDTVARQWEVLFRELMGRIYF